MNKKVSLLILVCLFYVNVTSAQDITSFKYSVSDFSPIDLLVESDKTNYGSVSNITRSSGKNVFLKVMPSVVKVLTNEGSGSGVILSNEGKALILTNFHVIDGYSEVGLQFANDADKEGVTLGTVVKFDEIKDLALIKVNEKRADIIPVSVASAPIFVGDDVHAIGHPLGEDWTYTRGYVSQKRANYSWQTSPTKHHVASVIQTQTPINPGNSGGPLVNNQGELVGINTFGNSKAQGLNYSIANESVQRFLQSDTSVQRKVILESGFGVILDTRDANKNGDPDGYQFDGNGNDITDLILIDDNEDLVADMIMIDKNENDIFEVVIIDFVEKSENYIVYKFDRDEDGTVEAIGFDFDMDGEIDKIIPAD